MTIQRTPIVGIRVPIVGITRIPVVGIERIPITGCQLNWDEVYEKYVNYIKFAAKQVSEQYQTGAVQSAEDLFQEGQLILYNCWTLYGLKDLAEFGAIFKASLWRKLREIGKKQQNTPLQVDIEDAYDIGYSDDVVEDIYEEYKLQQIAEMLANKPIALTILKEFINPSKRTIWEASMDVARKQTLKEQEQLYSAPKTVVIKGVHIQRALEIPKVSFSENLKIVKDALSSVYSLESDNFTDKAELDEVLGKIKVAYSDVLQKYA